MNEESEDFLIKDGWVHEMSIQRKTYSVNGSSSIKNINMTTSIPRKWCVKITNGNKKLLEKWRQTVCSPKSENSCLMKDALNKYLLCDNYKFSDHMYWGKGIPEGYTEISFEDFKTFIINKTPPKEHPENLSYLIDFLKQQQIN